MKKWPRHKTHVETFTKCLSLYAWKMMELMIESVQGFVEIEVYAYKLHVVDVNALLEVASEKHQADFHLHRLPQN
jgi:hypothetical protein